MRDEQTAPHSPWLGVGALSRERPDNAVKWAFPPRSTIALRIRGEEYKQPWRREPRRGAALTSIPPDPL